MFQKIGFIGTGSMGGILAAATAGSVPGVELLLANRTREKAEKLASELEKITGVRVVSNREAAEQSELLYLAIKPAGMGAMLEEISPVLASRWARHDRFILVSPAAGVKIEEIRRMVGFDCPVIRQMPNTPCAVGKGVVLYCAEGITPEEEEQFRDSLEGAGLVDALPEKQMDAGCALSGCGPAYVFQFIEAMADGGVAAGLPREKALRYAAATLLGGAQMVLETGKHPGELKDMVTSPGGSTIQGVRILEERAFRGAVMDAVLAAYDKSAGK